MGAENLVLWDKVRKVEDDYKERITGGRLNGKTSIKPIWRIKKLTEEFGVIGIGWYYEILDKRFEKGSNDEISVFVDIALYVKQADIWSKPIIGTGGSSYVAKEKGGLYTSDEAVKMAVTDAIGVACKNLGFAADVYSGGAADAEDKYAMKKADESFHDVLIIKSRIEKLLTQKMKEVGGIDNVAKQIGISAKDLQSYLSMADRLLTFELKLQKVKPNDNQ